LKSSEKKGIGAVEADEQGAEFIEPCESAFDAEALFVSVVRCR